MPTIRLLLNPIRTAKQGVQVNIGKDGDEFRAILPGLARKKAAAVLLAMDALGRSRIMRLLDDGLMQSVMDQMPKGAARDLARFLHYPEGSAGAWMSPNVATFDRSSTVRDCLAPAEPSG